MLKLIKKIKLLNNIIMTMFICNYVFSAWLVCEIKVKICINKAFNRLKIAKEA